MVSPSNGTNAQAALLDAALARTGWPVQVTHVASSQVAQAVLDSVGTMGRGYYDGW